jgi:hypothetical protein
VVARVQQAAAALLAFDQVDFNQTIFLSKYYEEIQAEPGVVFVNITEFRRADSPLPGVDPLGTIPLGPNEVPVIPDDPQYAGGLHLVVVTRAGA